MLLFSRSILHAKLLRFLSFTEEQESDAILSTKSSDPPLKAEGGVIVT